MAVWVGAMQKSYLISSFRVEKNIQCEEVSAIQNGILIG
jgi:hypothetical protein